MKFLHSLLFLINIAFALVLLASYLSPYISPEANKYIPILGLLYPAFFTLNIAFFVFWIFTKWTYSLLSLCALLIGFSASQRFVAFNSPKVIKSEKILDVVSYNVATGRMMRKESLDEFYKFLGEDLSTSVVFLQESSSKINDVLIKKWGKDNVVIFPKKRALILSKHPIIKSGTLEFDNAFNTSVWADISFKGQLVRLYSVHLQSNSVTKIAETVREDGEIVEKETWGKVAQMLRLYNKATKKRLVQVNTLLEHASKVNYPVIIGGDFNDVPQSYIYAKMTDSFDDTFTERGSGLGTSFNGAIPSLRIDYLFISDHFTTLDYSTRKEDFSDHYPISTRLLFKED